SRRDFEGSSVKGIAGYCARPRNWTPTASCPCAVIDARVGRSGGHVQRERNTNNLGWIGLVEIVADGAHGISRDITVTQASLGVIDRIVRREGVHGRREDEEEEHYADGADETIASHYGVDPFTTNTNVQGLVP